MSTYYEYQDVKVMIALELMKRNGWKVYGYHEDNSDAMTDYWDPAYWDGLAEKNGYILVVDKSYAEKEQEIRSYASGSIGHTGAIQKKIEKLQQMTVDRGASEQEEATAKASIEKLLAKANEEANAKMEYTVTGVIPAHMANPPRCNWHIEKNGVIVAKGNGILKYASIDEYFKYDRYRDDMMEFKRKSREQYIEEYERSLINGRYSYTPEEAAKAAESHYKNMEEKAKLFDAFNQFIGKLDTTAGGLMGEAEYEYQKVKVTEYKTEYKAVEAPGEIKEGQCYILKVPFNHGCNKGYVYRIHESKAEFPDGKSRYSAVKLNRKLTKECNGTAGRGNHMFYCSHVEEIQKWIDKGSIAFCVIQEVKTPYEVEKVVKVPLKKKEPAKGNPQYTYDIREDTDTRNNSKLWVVKVLEKLEREEYQQVNKKMKELGGYYSRFKKGFIFRTDPTEALAA